MCRYGLTRSSFIPPPNGDDRLLYLNMQWSQLDSAYLTCIYPPRDNNVLGWALEKAGVPAEYRAYILGQNSDLERRVLFINWRRNMLNLAEVRDKCAVHFEIATAHTGTALGPKVATLWIAL